MCTQMPARIGIRKYGEEAIAAMFKKLKQLNDGAVKELNHPVIWPIHPSKINNEEKKRALDAVNLIKKKRCGKIKGKTCADGSKQKYFLRHNESISSPTVSLEGIIGLLLIGAHEGRDVAIFDVPGSYLQAEMTK